MTLVTAAGFSESGAPIQRSQSNQRPRLVEAHKVAAEAFRVQQGIRHADGLTLAAAQAELRRNLADLPRLPSVLGRADRWFDRMNEVQRIGIVFLMLMVLAAPAAAQDDAARRRAARR